MFTTQQQLDTLAAQLIDNGHSIGAWEHGDNVYVIICTRCRIPFYVTRYSGAYNSYSFGAPCSNATPRVTHDTTLDAPTVACAYCGNGYTLSGKGCKHCRQQDKASLNMRYTELLPQQVRHDNGSIKRLMQIERYSMDATTAPQDRLYCTCGRRCAERGIYIDIERPCHISADHYQRWYRQVPLVIYNCPTQCKHIGYLPASATVAWRRSRARVYTALAH